MLRRFLTIIICASEKKNGVQSEWYYETSYFSSNLSMGIECTFCVILTGLVSFLLHAPELSCDYVQRLGFCLAGERVRNASMENGTQKFCVEFISYSLTMTSKL